VEIPPRPLTPFCRATRNRTANRATPANRRASVWSVVAAALIGYAAATAGTSGAHATVKEATATIGDSAAVRIRGVSPVVA
jgi:hypothetical protein